IHTTCEGWYLTRGTLTFTPSVQPPYLDGDHSFTEEAFGFLLLNLIPGYVDGVVRDAINGFQGGVLSPTTAGACNTLGVSTTTQGFPFDSINFDVYPTIFHSGLTPDIAVTVKQVKRLTLHDMHGGVLYYPQEIPHLLLYAGHSALPITLPPMVEGQI